MNISITNGDPSFDLVLVYIISKIAGVTSVVALAPIIMINGVVNIIYTGLELDSSTASLQDILIPSVIYNQVGTIGQLNDILYIGNLKINDYNDLQLVANNIKIAWVSNLIQNVDTLNEKFQDPNDNSNLSNIYQGSMKGFQHEEVYSFYIRFILNTGQTTKAFHIPGNSAINYNGSSSPLSENNNTYLALNPLNLKLNNNTVARPSFAYDDYLAYNGIINDGSTGLNPSGNTGIWYSNEQYDILDPYISKIANDGLGNYNVRLHKMPTIRWCYNNLYGEDGILRNPSYGITALDMLGIQASGQDANGNQIDILTLVANLVNQNLLPREYNSILIGYEILYAERGLGNISVIGQSLSLYNYNQISSQTNNNLYHTSFPNITQLTQKDLSETTQNTYTINYSSIKFHSFDILLNKPQDNYNHLSQQLYFDVLNRDTYQNWSNSGDIPFGVQFTNIFINFGFYLKSNITPRKSRGNEGPLIGIVDLTNNGINYIIFDQSGNASVTRLTSFSSISPIDSNNFIRGINSNITPLYVSNNNNTSNQKGYITLISKNNNNINLYNYGCENHLLFFLNNSLDEPQQTGISFISYEYQYPSKTFAPDLRCNKMASSTTSKGSDPPKKYRIYLSNVLNLSVSQYNSVFNQTLIETGIVFFNSLTPNSNDYNVSYKGDVFLNNYSFEANSSANPLFPDNNNDGYAGSNGGNGIKIIYRFICESINPIFFRRNNLIQDNQGNIPDRVYDPNQVSSWNLTYQGDNLLSTSIYNAYWEIYYDPNTWQGYYIPTNSQNDINNISIYIPGYIQPNEFPFRIARSTKLSLQNAFRSWRNFLPLDYYELQKNYGNIVALNGMTDKLMIHTLNSLFYTRDKAAITGGEGTGLPITLTTTNGDIFQFEPQQVQESKLGYLGTLSDLSVSRNPAGYFYVDTRVGEVYMFTPDVFRVGQNKYLNEGNNIFLRQYLKIQTTNNNSYIGNGVFFGYDQKYKRIIMTCKNVVVTPPNNYIIVTNDNYKTTLPQCISQNLLALYDGVFYNVTQEVKSCPNMLPLSITNIGTNQATVSFTYLDPTYLCNYVLVLMYQVSETIITTITIPTGIQGQTYSNTFNNLLQSTGYTIKVTPICSTCNKLLTDGASSQISFNTTTPPTPPDPFRIAVNFNQITTQTIVNTQYYDNWNFIVMGTQPTSATFNFNCIIYSNAGTPAMPNFIARNPIQISITIMQNDNQASIINKCNNVISSFYNSYIVINNFQDEALIQNGSYSVIKYLNYETNGGSVQPTVPYFRYTYLLINYSS